MAPKLDDFMQWPEIEALEYGECSRPQDVLGARMADRSHVLVTAYFPEVDSVAVRVAGGKKEKKKGEKELENVALSRGSEKRIQNGRGGPAGILWGTDPRTQNSGICIYG